MSTPWTCPECGEPTRDIRPKTSSQGASITGRACACERKWKEEIDAGQRSMNVDVSTPQVKP